MKNKKIKLSIGFTLISSCIAAQAEASSLYGSCQAYVEKQSSTAVAFNFQNAGILIANSFINIALTSGAAPEAVKNIYSIAYAARGGIAEESTAIADPDLASCLAQFESRLSLLEETILTDLVQGSLTTIYDQLDTDLKDGLYYKHKETSNKFFALANQIGVRIKSRFAAMEAGTSSPATYTALLQTLIPGYVSSIQLGFMHLAEFDNYCYNLSSPPSWNGISDDKLIHASTLSKINNGEEIDNYLTRSDNSSYNECTVGNTSFTHYINISRSGTQKDVLASLGIHINQHDISPFISTATLDLTQSKLIDYRASLISECVSVEGNDKFSKYGDDYTGWSQSNKSNFGNNKTESLARCNLGRDARIASIRSDKINSSDQDVKSLLNALTITVDTWDVYNLITTKDKARGITSNIPTYTGVRLKHATNDKCIAYDATVTADCNTTANHYMFSPFSTAYAITRLADNRKFKDKGQSTGFTISTSFDGDAIWNPVGPNDKNLYQLENTKTGKCLDISDFGDKALITNTCSASNEVWEINGTNLPINTMMRIKNVDSDTCISLACNDDTYPLRLYKHFDGYRVSTLADRHLKDRTDTDIVIRDNSSGTDSAWYIVDTDHDGKYKLQNQHTGRCLDTNNGVLVPTSCVAGVSNEIWEFEAPKIPTSNPLEISASTTAWCLGGFSSMYQAYSMNGCSFAMLDTMLVAHNNGYLILNSDEGTYMRDLNIGNGHASIQPGADIAEDTTWDFIGPFENGNYQIINRATGLCAVPIMQNGGHMLVEKDVCGESTKLWQMPII